MDFHHGSATTLDDHDDRPISNTNYLSETFEVHNIVHGDLLEARKLMKDFLRRFIENPSHCQSILVKSSALRAGRARTNFVFESIDRHCSLATFYGAKY